jgi:cytosine/adenosine deaminase-related metal-dependent hydrolase
MTDRVLGRWLFLPEGLREGYMRLDGDHIEEICMGRAPEGSLKAVILPALVNSHVHIGDSVAYPAPKGTVQEIVGPPDGHKHRILRTTPLAAKIAAMEEASAQMLFSGTSMFADFREEGLEGIRSLRRALEGSPLVAKILGRPVENSPGIAEVEGILAEADGFGASSLSDWPYDVLGTLSRKAKSAGKLFAMHASESFREDIDLVLDLKPDFLVHMCKATDDDIESCVEAHVPVVICPRSNEFFGLDPRLPRLLKAGAVIALGTDNGMIARPDMFEEMKACLRMNRDWPGISPDAVVRLATFNGRKVLNAEPKITTEINAQSDLLVVKVKSDDPLREMVTSSRSEDIEGMAKGGEFRRTSAWMR